MAATYTKPTKKPRWGTTTSNITEPSEGKKNLGWFFKEIPPSDIENWRAHTVETWFDWIDERIFDGASADELLFKSPGNASDALKITDTLNRSYKSFVPNTDNTYDLGSISLEWRDLFIDGTANVDTLILSIGGGEGVGSSLNPITDGTFNLGSPSYEWQDLFIDGTANIDLLSLGTSPGEGIGSHCLPASDNIYDLGNLLAQWKDLYLDGTANIDILAMSTTAGEGVGSNLNPTTDDTYNLGSPSYEWQDLFIDGTANVDTLILSTAVSEGIGSDLLPDTANTYDIGSFSRGFANGYFDSGVETPAISTTGDIVVTLGSSNTFRPSGTLGMSLGTSAYKWEDNHFWGLTLYNPYPLVLDDDTTPSNPDSSRVKGTIAWDASYLYVKTADTNGWKRTALTAF